MHWKQESKSHFTSKPWNKRHRRSKQKSHRSRNGVEWISEDSFLKQWAIAMASLLSNTSKQTIVWGEKKRSCPLRWKVFTMLNSYCQGHSTYGNTSFLWLWRWLILVPCLHTSWCFMTLHDVETPFMAFAWVLSDIYFLNCKNTEAKGQFVL